MIFNRKNYARICWWLFDTFMNKRLSHHEAREGHEGFGLFSYTTFLNFVLFVSFVVKLRFIFGCGAAAPCLGGEIHLMAAQHPIIAVEDDPFLRLIQVILDPNTPQERVAAFAHFMAHDEPDFIGWCERLRAQLGALYPAEVRLFNTEEELLERLPGAQIVAVESIGIGAQAIAAAGGALKIVQKYGTITAGIDHVACAAAGVRVLTLRRRANIATAEHGLALMLALARRINQNFQSHQRRAATGGGFHADDFRPRAYTQRQLG